MPKSIVMSGVIFVIGTTTPANTSSIALNRHSADDAPLPAGRLTEVLSRTTGIFVPSNEQSIRHSSAAIPFWFTIRTGVTMP